MKFGSCCKLFVVQNTMVLSKLQHNARMYSDCLLLNTTVLSKLQHDGQVYSDLLLQNTTVLSTVQHDGHRYSDRSIVLAHSVQFGRNTLPQKQMAE